MCAEMQTKTVRRIESLVAVRALKVCVIQGVQTHGIRVYGLVIIIVNYVMIRTRLQRMELQFMRSHISPPAESLAANIAMVVFNTSMGYHMLGEIAGCVEGLWTERAYLIPHSQVNLLMRLKVAQCRELFGAYLTLKWLVARVSPFMDF